QLLQPFIGDLGLLERQILQILQFDDMVEPGVPHHSAIEVQSLQFGEAGQRLHTLVVDEREVPQVKIDQIGKLSHMLQAGVFNGEVLANVQLLEVFQAGELRQTLARHRSGSQVEPAEFAERGYVIHTLVGNGRV